jgi:membrane associated rhomboid family serine protease
MGWVQHGVVRQQRALLVLVGVICVAYVLQLIFGREGYGPFMATPAHVVASWNNLRAGDFAMKDFAEFGTMISCAFLHADGSHIVYNLVFLWLFAALTQELLGSTWTLAIFFFTAFTASLCHILLNPASPNPMLGASGTVMGFEGAYLGMAVRWKLPEPHVFPLARPIPPSHLGIVAVAGAMIDWTSIMNHSGSNVAFGAHLGGFVGGIFLTSFIARKPRMADVR